MDMTLYTHAEYARFQVDCIVGRAASRGGISPGEMREAIAAYRKDWAASHGGRGTSLGNVLAAMGVSVEENIRWREELLEPGDYLRRDQKLRQTLAALAPRYALALVTNNPVLVAGKTLRALGVEDYFPVIIGMDTLGVSKPHRAPFLKAAEKLGLAPSRCVSIGDRYEVDIELPLELGMGGILVQGVEDVYGLPAFLSAGERASAEQGVSGRRE
jgi:phosphoglycolate phosphatase/putative hydrolase of the HAD superfamily